MARPMTPFSPALANLSTETPTQHYAPVHNGFAGQPTSIRPSAGKRYHLRQFASTAGHFIMISYYVSQLLVCASLLGVVLGQGVGKEQYEIPPNITWKSCSAPGDCTDKRGKITLDQNWRWIHDGAGYSNCFEGQDWNPRICPNSKECTKSCVIEGADYKQTYGITTKNDSLSLKYKTYLGFATTVSSRTFLLKDDNTYEIFKLAPNREFSFDVDVSLLPCGLSGSLFFVAMDEDGGRARFPTNKAGAKYGTGYCDASCPRDLKFINGEANSEGWVPSEVDVFGGAGAYGSCCAEMNIWQANSVSTAMTARACSVDQQTRCTYSSGECSPVPYSDDRSSLGVCESEGCDINPFRVGNEIFYGKRPGKQATIDTMKKFTVVTQFIGTGKSLEIKRFYIQNNVTFASPESSVPGVKGSSLSDKFCNAQKEAFGERNQFAEKGGMATMYKALEKGMVLVMAVTDDPYSNMLWLDSTYPTYADPSRPGVMRGECATNSGIPVHEFSTNDGVTFSNIKFGPLNSTYAVQS